MGLPKKLLDLHTHFRLFSNYKTVLKWCHILISECLEEIKFLHLSALWNSLWSLPGENRLGHKPPTLSSSEEMRVCKWRSYIKTIVVLWAVVCHSSSVKCGEGTITRQLGEGESGIILCKPYAGDLRALMQWMSISHWSSSEGNSVHSPCLTIWKGAERFPWLYLQHVIMRS